MDTTTHHINMNNYIDTHCHVLYKLDDGAKTIDESINMLKNYERLGFTKIILTPHYKNAYHLNNKGKKKLFNKLKKRVKEEGINIKLYLANEVRISGDILSLIKSDEISMLGNNLFLELPFTNSIIGLDNIIFELESMGINVILVHPERYLYLKKKDYENLISKDVMFQVNYESIIGTYGRESKKRVKYLLKNNMVTLLGSDAHSENANFFTKFPKIEKKIVRIVGENKYKDLTYKNIEKMIEDTERKTK